MSRTNIDTDNTAYPSTVGKVCENSGHSGASRELLREETAQQHAGSCSADAICIRANAASTNVTDYRGVTNDISRLK